ncbi:hypothetical protein DFR58_1345 [Anaerobacterium chartisolvens]|uniref:TadE-like protein n=1 Tax=Anaerobacterium chartisolvens TaxID=1297424 RepID=A0A369AKA8_9FIRM|nr:hypothetical protein [Anaerobacterium chartisolvens]RCX09601.1 hypothetical protein DFR58_1345 [Anaerobacterium chartisolvens]
MKALRRFSPDRGSTTIEAILVVWCIVIVLAAVIYSFLIMNQRVLLASIASKAAQQGVEVWLDEARSMEDGFLDTTRRTGLKSLYSQLTDGMLFRGGEYEEFLDAGTINGNSPAAEGDIKVLKIRNCVVRDMKKGLLKPLSTYMKVEFKNILIQREIKVTLQQEISIPLGGIKAIFDGKSTLTLVAVGTADVSEPAEYIRNIDLLAEYSSKGFKASGISAKLEQLKERFK